MTNDARAERSDHLHLRGRLPGRSEWYLPDLAPGLAARWYDGYTAHFWQERFGAIGFREFPHDVGVERWWDVDAGPVIFGYGFAATAFGIGAARANGRLDHAVPLTALAIAASWPLPDGTLLLPRLLSHATEAPYLGEAGILFILTRPLPSNVTPTAEVRFPWLLYAILAAYSVVAFILLWAAAWEIRSARLSLHVEGRYLLDTKVLSHLLKHPAGVIGVKNAAVGEEAVCTSIVVACELRYGAAKKGSPALSTRVAQLLSTIEVLPIDEGVDAKGEKGAGYFFKRFSVSNHVTSMS